MPRPPRVFEEPNPSGVCQCGCGQQTPLAPYTRFDREWVRGKPVKRIPGHGRRKHSLEYIVDPETQCWNWAGGINSSGYGVYERDRKRTVAHRFIYERNKGPIPEGKYLDHICKNRRCVNPDHLQPVTNSEHAAIETARGVNRKTSLELQEAALRLKGTMSARAAADMVGIHRGTVNRLWARGHVK